MAGVFLLHALLGDGAELVVDGFDELGVAVGGVVLDGPGALGMGRESYVATGEQSWLNRR